MVPIPLSRKRKYPTFEEVHPSQIHAPASSSKKPPSPSPKPNSKIQASNIPSSFKVTKITTPKKQAVIFELNHLPTSPKNMETKPSMVNHVSLVIIDSSDDEIIISFSSKHVLIRVPEKLPKKTPTGFPFTKTGTNGNKLSRGKMVLVGGAAASQNYVLVGGVAENQDIRNTCTLLQSVPLLVVDHDSSDDELIDLTGDA